MIDRLSNTIAAAPGFTSLVIYIMLMALLIGNAVRLSRRRACKVKSSASRPRAA